MLFEEEETDIQCPECRIEFLTCSEWWDDDPDMGGGCIGLYYECPNCGYWYSE